MQNNELGKYIRDIIKVNKNHKINLKKLFSKKKLADKKGKY